MEYYKLKVLAALADGDAEGWDNLGYPRLASRIDQVHSDGLISYADYKQLTERLYLTHAYDEEKPQAFLFENVGDSTVQMWATWFAQRHLHDDFIAVNEKFVGYDLGVRFTGNSEGVICEESVRFSAPMNWAQKRPRNLMMVRVSDDFSVQYSMFMNHDVTMDVPAEMILIDLLMQYAVTDDKQKVADAIEGFLDSEEEMWDMEYRSRGL